MWASPLKFFLRNCAEFFEQIEYFMYGCAKEHKRPEGRDLDRGIAIDRRGARLRAAADLSRASAAAANQPSAGPDAGASAATGSRIAAQAPSRRPKNQRAKLAHQGYEHRADSQGGPSAAAGGRHSGATAIAG
jgi:hypothetical protein